MNKVILMGRLTDEPKIMNGTVAKYNLAVDRRYKKEGSPTADFFSIVSFGKAAEFVEKYLHKGTKIVLEGQIQNNNYTNKDGQKVYAIQIVTDSIEFAESKAKAQETQEAPQPDADGFMTIPDGIENELPFI